MLLQPSMRTFLLYMVPRVTCPGPSPSGQARLARCVECRVTSMASLWLLSSLSALSPSLYQAWTTLAAGVCHQCMLVPSIREGVGQRTLTSPHVFPGDCAPTVEPVTPDMQYNVNWLSRMTSCHKLLCVRPMQITSP